MNNKKKPIILQVLPSLISGGVERGTIEIAKALANSTYTSFVASSGGRLVIELEKLNIKHFTLSLHSKNPLTIFRNSKILEKIIKENNINIIHARSRAPAWSAYLAAKKTNIKFITTFHGVYKFGSYLKKLYNSIMTKGDKIIAVSKHVRDHIIANYNIPKDKIKLIYRGVDLDYFNSEDIDLSAINHLKKQIQIDSNLPIILLPGRLTRWKGQLYLIEALRLLPANSFTCLIVGDDKGHISYRNEIQNMITSSHLTTNIKIIGNISNMPILYRISDIVVSASLEPEAFGRVAVEAQAMGKLTIATNIGGSRETIIHNETGWLVSPGDISELAETISKLLNFDSKQKENYAKKARNHIIQNFSLNQMTSQTINLYLSIL